MDREQLLREASRLSRIIADDVTRILHQRGLVEELRTTTNSAELEQAEDVLKVMLDEQTQHEKELVRVQARLIF
jgi:hypothetical protein